MVHIAQLLLPLISSVWPSQEPLSVEHGIIPRKSVAIIGTGSAGLAMVKTLLDFPAEVRQGLEISVYEERENVAGVW